MIKDSSGEARKAAFPYFALATCLPLVLGLGFFIFPDFSPFAPSKLETIFVGYATLLLGFFSGIRFGTKLLSKRSGNVWIVPFIAGPLLGLMVLSVPFSLALAMLATGFGAHGAWDSLSAFRGKLPTRYTAMRTTTTWIICAILILVFIINGVEKAGI
ncbi:MAG: DUF3429 domain-containing protein [Devosiaceae bacterium]|nr:DUF3429 domain-containing protein [Devosiaceae bacterium]